MTAVGDDDRDEVVDGDEDRDADEEDGGDGVEPDAAAVALSLELSSNSTRVNSRLKLAPLWISHIAKLSAK